MTDKKRQPLAPTWQYTTREGGNWIDWPKDRAIPITQYLYWLVNGGPTADVQGVKAHSLHCSNGYRWDCINGMTNYAGGKSVNNAPAANEVIDKE